MANKERAREAATNGYVPGSLQWHERAEAADIASHVWEDDMVELAILLSDKTVAPEKRIQSAIAWINDEVQASIQLG